MTRSSTAIGATAKQAEQQLLLCCIRHTHAPVLTRQMRMLLQMELNWDHIFQMARQHRIMPLLYQNLKASCPDVVPQDMLDLLRQHFLINMQCNLFLTAELLKILQVFETHDILAVPYKGPILAASAYRNLALRQFSDLDILLHKDDIPQASRLLRSLGYQAHSHPNYACEFTSNDAQTVVELHWEPVGFASSWQTTSRYCAFQFDLDGLWDRLEPVALGGTSVQNLSPEDLLLILCAHGSKHLWERLIWICDVAQLLYAQQDIDWGQVTRQANRLGGECMLNLGLRLAHDILDAPLPEDVWQRVQQDTTAASLAIQVCQRLFVAVDQPRKRFEEPVFSIQMRERWRDKVSFFLHYVHIYLHSALTSMEKKQALMPLLIWLTCTYKIF